MSKPESNFFVYDCGTHYSNGHLLIRNKIDRLRCLRLELYVIMFLLALHDNVLIIFFYSGRSAQLYSYIQMHDMKT